MFEPDQCGSENPDSLWWYVKKVIKEKDPALYEKIPEKLPYRKPLEEDNTIQAGTVADAINGMQEATDKFFDSCKDMGLLQQDQTVVTHAVITAEPINEPVDPEDVKSVGSWASTALTVKTSCTPGRAGRSRWLPKT